MHHNERLLQQLRIRFNSYLNWLNLSTGSEVRIVPTGVGNAFQLVATWGGDKEYRKTYDAATALRQGRVRCVRDYARSFIEEVLKERGVL